MLDEQTGGPPPLAAAALAELTAALAGFPPLGPWVTDAACGPLTLAGSEVFLSSVPGSRGRALAVAVCAGCPVRPECAAYADRAPVHGVWGGRWYETSRTRRAGRTAA